MKLFAIMCHLQKVEFNEDRSEVSNIANKHHFAIAQAPDEDSLKQHFIVMASREDVTYDLGTVQCVEISEHCGEGWMVIPKSEFQDFVSNLKFDTDE